MPAAHIAGVMHSIRELYCRDLKQTNSLITLSPQLVVGRPQPPRETDVAKNTLSGSGYFLLAPLIDR